MDNPESSELDSTQLSSLPSTLKPKSTQPTTTAAVHAARSTQVSTPISKAESSPVESRGNTGVVEKPRPVPKVPQPQKQKENESAVKERGSKGKVQETTTTSRVKIKEKQEEEELPESPKHIPLIPKYHKQSRRVKYVQPGEAVEEKESEADTTIKGEKRFLKRLEKHKGKRLLRVCYCDLTCWVRFKDTAEIVRDSVSKYLRAFSILCCPPCCTIPNRIAFWPPPRAYFFFRAEEADATTKAEQSTDNDDGRWLLELSARKKKYKKLKKANKKAIEGTWRVGINHRCVEDVEDAEGFVLESESGNFIACIKVPCLKHTTRYSIIYSHPSGSDLSDHLLGMPSLKDMARFYRSDIYSYDYSGYGVSSGRPSESNQNADIRTLYRHLTETLKIPPSKIVVMGYSIGTSASVDLVLSMNVHVAGLILEAPPTSIMRVILWNRGCFKQPWKEETSYVDRFSTFDKVQLLQM